MEHRHLNVAGLLPSSSLIHDHVSRRRANSFPWFLKSAWFVVHGQQVAATHLCQCNSRTEDPLCYIELAVGESGQGIRVVQVHVCWKLFQQSSCVPLYLFWPVCAG